MGFISLSVFVAFSALMLWAAFRDATSYTIPNWISLALIGAFAVSALLVRLPLATGLVCLAVGFTVLVLGVGMFAAGWFGGGDIKLFSAAALWFGWPGLSRLFLLTVLFGGALALGLMLLRSRRVAPHAARGPAWLSRLALPGRQMPYGIAIALGAMLAWPASPFWR